MDDLGELLRVYMARYVILQDACIEASMAPLDRVRGILAEALYLSMLGPGELKTARDERVS